MSVWHAGVTDLARPFPVSLNAISKHIKVLERAGLVHRRIIGRDHYLELVAEPLQEAVGWIALYRGFWEPRLDALEAMLAVKRSLTRDLATLKRLLEAGP